MKAKKLLFNCKRNIYENHVDILESARMASSPTDLLSNTHDEHKKFIGTFVATFENERYIYLLHMNKSLPDELTPMNNSWKRHWPLFKNHF